MTELADITRRNTSIEEAANDLEMRGGALAGGKTIVLFPEAAFGLALNCVGIAQKQIELRTQRIIAAQEATTSSRATPTAAASAATVKKAGVAMRPVSILRSVSAGTPETAAISAMLRGPRASRSSMPSRCPRSCSRRLSGGRTIP